MNVSLTPELERFVDDQVSTGRYRSASEFVRECIRVRMEIEEEKRAKLQALRRLIDDLVFTAGDAEDLQVRHCGGSRNVIAAAAPDRCPSPRSVARLRLRRLVRR